MGITRFFTKLFSNKNNDIEIYDDDSVLLQAESVMIRRHEIEPIYNDYSNQEIIQAFQKTNLPYLPLCGENLDDIIGVCSIVDFADKLLHKKKDLKIHDVAFVASNTDLFEVLTYLYEKQFFAAIVVDEFGGTDGIITEEAITRSFYQKYKTDKQVLEKTKEFVVLPGKIPLKKIAKMCQIDISEYDADTLGGFVAEYFGKTPKKNDFFIINNIKFIVAESDNKSIKKVLIRFIKNIDEPNK